MAAAISRTVTPLGFSLETGLAMNSNRFCRAASSAGKTRRPCRPTTMRSPLRTSVIGMQRAASPSAIDEDAAVHLLIFHVDPFAVEADLRAVVGGAVEALGKGAVHVGRRRSTQSLTADGHGAVVVDGVEDFAELVGGAARTSMRA